MSAFQLLHILIMSEVQRPSNLVLHFMNLITYGKEPQS